MNLIIEILLGILIIFVYLTFYNISNNFKKCIEYGNNFSITDYLRKVTIIKPSKGSDEFTLSNFNSWINQKYNAQIEYIFSFDKDDYESIKIASDIHYSNKKILSNPVMNGFTGKMSAIYHGLMNSTYEILIFSDGDTLAQEDTVAKIMSRLGEGAKIVTCLAIYNQTKNIWARLYASSWNLAEIGMVGTSILKRGDQIVGNTFALSKTTLAEIGGLEKFKNYIAEDIAIGKAAHSLNIPISLGPIIESPVGKMSFSTLLDKYSRAALYAITMKGLVGSWQHIVIYSYFLLLLPPLIFLYNEVLIAVFILAIGRLTFASYLWYLTNKEVRIFFECFLEDVLFFLVYIKALLFKTMIWSNRTYHVDSSGKITSAS